MNRTLAMIWILNVFDAVATVYVTTRGVEELNPVMGWALALGPSAFVAVKMSVIAVACACLYRVSTSSRSWHRLVAAAIAGAAVTGYSALGVFHVYGIYSIWS